NRFELHTTACYWLDINCSERLAGRERTISHRPGSNSIILSSQTCGAWIVSTIKQYTFWRHPTAEGPECIVKVRFSRVNVWMIVFYVGDHCYFRIQTQKHMIIFIRFNYKIWT